MDIKELLIWASQQAEIYVSPLGNRWLHVQSVVEKAREIGSVFNEEDRCYLIAAAYLHDIAYAPDLQRTGFHPIDGAYYLRQQEQERLASLVAYHSEARFEAELRGLSQELHQFEPEHSPVADALIYCDMMTNSKGDRVSFSERLADIYRRYDKNHIVSKAIHQAEPFLAEAVRRTEQRLTIHK
ncbi:HD domain-containing protein [Dictyobacter aurantiacus]|uniref:Metal-dependent phosphohydrolase, HD subdomain protein n=1 Tax=Dictyobacter aurantiacus TaxID=1936993 RepID=A0A401ZBH4_9CHLR|nr:HD domain-containing protein [Dictyobacter aurantiacus]GCE04244.1 metal-dependent phosphohydrolase, HD subdomain protein [Dictyobacter aurantiacus]